jgi:hypothetical protein
LVNVEFLNVSWDVGFETTLNKASTRQNTLFILYKDDSGQIVQQEYAINEPFEINFSNEQWVRQIKHDGNGNIIVAVEHKIAQPVGAQESAPEPADNYELPPCSDVTVTVSDTSKGDILHIEGCPNWTYDSPPLAKGEYALSPNGKFLVYCTNNGDLYTIRFGESSPRFIENLRKKMIVFRNGDVSLIITIYEGENQYFANIMDQYSGQNVNVKIPLSVSQ